MMNAFCCPPWRRSAFAPIVVTFTGLFGVGIHVSAINVQQLHERDSGILEPTDHVACALQGHVTVFVQASEATGTLAAQQFICSHGMKAVTHEIGKLADGPGTSSEVPVASNGLSHDRS